MQNQLQGCKKNVTSQYGHKVKTLCEERLRERQVCFKQHFVTQHDLCKCVCVCVQPVSAYASKLQASLRILDS